MKNRIFLSAIVALAAVGMWSCTQNSGGGATDVANQSLKEAINNSADQVSTAMNDISSSDGYKVITSGNSNLKSADASVSDDEMFSDSITLADVAGVYEYQDSVLNEMHWGYSSYMYNHFKMTADTSLFIIKLPEKLALHHPEYCFYKTKQDTDSLGNNFVITTSKYKYKYAYPGGLNYSLGSDIAVSDTAVGNLDIEWSMNGMHRHPYNYASTFTFASGYAVSMQAERTDTTKLYDYNLSDGDQTIYDEMVKWSKDTGADTYTKVHSLTIGDVQIVHTRTAGSDSLEVYKGGELQQNATVTVVDNNSSENDSDAEYTTFCNKYRDYQITFDDSTTVLLSDLLGPTRDTMSQLFTSMHEMKFATHLVNYIAWNVYFRDKMKMEDN
ncbi:hypothetical protein [Prolixibacter sp. NT017]|uniref:hypothetical protein n=1 Tax=Prolixibacter sp. NT017 TaxID=2652390 RepID=UPI001298EB7E|nr:hypothetical protein [Prolixibacter sp. NT017]